MFPLNDNFDATSLDSLEPVFNELLSRDLKSVSDLEIFFLTSQIWPNMSRRLGRGST